MSNAPVTVLHCNCDSLQDLLLFSQSLSNPSLESPLNTQWEEEEEIKGFLLLRFSTNCVQSVREIMRPKTVIVVQILNLRVSLFSWRRRRRRHRVVHHVQFKQMILRKPTTGLDGELNLKDRPPAIILVIITKLWFFSFLPDWLDYYYYIMNTEWNYPNKLHIISQPSNSCDLTDEDSLIMMVDGGWSSSSSKPRSKLRSW